MSTECLAIITESTKTLQTNRRRENRGEH